MSKRKAGIPQGFVLDVERPDETKPVRLGTFLEEDAIPRVRPSQIVRETPRPQPQTPPEGSVPAQPKADLPKRNAEQPRASAAVLSKRTRLNVSMEGRRRLAAIVDRMARYGPEPDVRASEVIEALVFALYDAREHLDLSNVRRRGKFGSSTHRNFPIALAESVAKAMASSQVDK